MATLTGVVGTDAAPEAAVSADARVRAVRNGVRATVALLGIVWGVGGAIVLPIVPFETAALILVVLAGIIASALTTLAADPLSIRSFLAGITLPVFVSLATSDQSHHV